MTDEKKKVNFGPFVLVSVIMLAGVLVFAVVKRQAAQETHIHEYSPVIEDIKDIGLPITKDTQPKLSLSDLINTRRGWNVLYPNLIGQPAPDFTATDLSGKVHKLSDYRGKNVMLVFWATWCLPCITEVPHIKAVNNVLDKENFQILAISYVTWQNSIASIRAFAKKYDTNYPLLPISLKSMPAPFSRINGFPSSFFIDPEGKIKLATEGTLTLGVIKAILLADK